MIYKEQKGIAMRTNYQKIIEYVNILGKYSNYKLPQKINFIITKNLINLEPFVTVYSKSLENIYRVYEPYTLKDDEGNILCYESGIHKVDDAHFKEYCEEITQLLETEAEVDLCHVDFSVFDYEDGEKYDVLSSVDLVDLRSILCETNLETVEDKDG